MINKTKKLAAVCCLFGAFALAAACSTTDTSQFGDGGGGVTLPDSTSGATDLPLAADFSTTPTPDTAVALPPGKPTPGFGDVCSQAKPCKTGTTCIGIAGWTSGFCTVGCNGSADTRCQDSLPATLDKTKILAGCVLTTATGAAPTSCAFICEIAASGGNPAQTRSCPPGLECTQATTGGKLCKPK